MSSEIAKLLTHWNPEVVKNVNRILFRAVLRAFEDQKNSVKVYGTKEQKYCDLQIEIDTGKKFNHNTILVKDTFHNANN